MLECVIIGDTAPDKLRRAKISRILHRNSSLLERLERSLMDDVYGLVWAAELDHVNRVVLKLARCHAAFELNEPQLHEPSHLEVKPLPLMTEEEREAFRMTGSDAFVKWLAVQEGNYRFRISQANGLTVKIVLREYLGCKVVWD